MIRLASFFYGPLPVRVYGFSCSIMHDRHRPENMARTGGVCPVCRANARALRNRRRAPLTGAIPEQ